MRKAPVPPTRRIVFNTLFPTSRNPTNIRVEQVVSGVNRTRQWIFTIQRSNLTVDLTFDSLLRTMRHHLADEAGFNGNHILALSFVPAESNHNALTRMVRLRTITSEFLYSQYLLIIQSDESLDLEGFKFIIEKPLDKGGAARKTLDIPDHLKERGGIGQHRQLSEYLKGGGQVTVPCGILAFLMFLEAPLFISNIHQLLEKGKELATLIELEGLYMDENDFQKILMLDKYKNYRILIFGFGGTVRAELKGVDWRWPEGQEPSIEDPKSVYIYLDVALGTQHYYYITAIRTICFYKSRRKGNRCFKCFKIFAPTKKHNCENVEIHRCEYCLKTFYDKKLFDEHLALFAQGYWKCYLCREDSFNGEDCLALHEKDCFPPDKDANGIRCRECLKIFPDNDWHECLPNDFGYCNKCEISYKSVQDREEHQCMMGRNKTWWKPVVGKRFNSHWFYDFETTRGKEFIEREKIVYEHEVMAWCLRLMIPDQITREFIEEKNYLQTIILLVEKNATQQAIKYQKIEDTVRIFGKDLSSFIFTCEKICTKYGYFHPTFWAHNGSKFDAKFILDYYLTVQRLDLAGDQWIETQVSTDGEVWKKKKINRNKRDTCNALLSGSKLLTLDVRNMRFRCSCVHHPTALRELPKRFGLNISVAKGEFPYSRLQKENWGKVLPHPELEEYQVDSMTSKRRSEVIKWYDSEPVQPWDFDIQLWKYLFADVDVGAKCMEAYHQSSEVMHQAIWEANPDLEQEHCSPLDFLTSPGWALAMYKSWFLPEIHVLAPAATKFIRDSLRGGRTDKRCNWLKLTREQREMGDKIVYFDFKSLYPSVQKCPVHQTHFPVGKGAWIGLSNLTSIEQPIEEATLSKGQIDNEFLQFYMRNKTGFLEIDYKILKYVTHPTLHRVGSHTIDGANKLLFELNDQQKQTYAWPEIEEAIRCGEIAVTFVHQAYLFDRGEDVFDKYVDFFFAQKEKAEVEGNEGKRALAKLLLNSLWGKLGQRSQPVKEWVSDIKRLEYLMTKFETGEFEMQTMYIKNDERIRLTYTRKDDKANRFNTAPHLAAFVSMWGRVILHRKLLSQHGMRALYCDTDSAVVYLRGGVDEMLYTGNNLGDLTDEVTKLAPRHFKDPYISEVVFLAPKSYALEIKCSITDETYQKVVCKGFEPSYDNQKVINFKAMKELVFTKYDLNSFMNGKRSLEEDEEFQEEVRLSILTKPRFSLKSSICREEISPRETMQPKSISGEYGKGSAHLQDPRFIKPFSNSFSPPEATFLNVRNAHYE